MQVEPATQTIAPVQPCPPHCPHFGTVPPEPPAVVTCAVVAALLVVVTVLLVVVATLLVVRVEAALEVVVVTFFVVVTGAPAGFMAGIVIRSIYQVIPPSGLVIPECVAP